MRSIRRRLRLPLPFSLLAVLLLQAHGLLPVAAQTVDSNYSKTFYANLVQNERAKIAAGALVQTWKSADTRTVVESILIKEGDPNATPPVREVKDYYRHCLDLINQKKGKFDTGFPLSNTNTEVTVGYNDSIQYSDLHRNKNSADALIDVKPLDTVPGRRVSARRPGGFRLAPLLNFVEIKLSGNAKAGLPIDGDQCHSADSHAAVEIEAGEVFQVIQDGTVPKVEVLGQNTVNGGSRAIRNNGLTTDPFFVTLTDLDNGDMFREVVMVQELEWENATYSMDDAGIRLTIDPVDPDSFVSLLFDSTLSSWVTEPYTYGARLDYSGFTAYGETPLAGWTITTTGDAVEAFYSFGEDGQPFDAVVASPDIQFTEGHTYAYDVGAGDGASVHVTVPEPSSAILAVLGFVVLARNAPVFARGKARAACARAT